jgi:hypothetical protein
MHSLPPPCPRCRANDATLLSTKEAFANDPPGDGDDPVATVAVFMCECGHVFTEVQRFAPADVPNR